LKQIKIRLIGGLGNQMFQLAAALNINGDKKILINSRYLSSYKAKRELDLRLILKQNNLIDYENKPRILHKLRLAKLGGPMRIRGLMNDMNYNNSLKCSSVHLDGYFSYVNQKYFSRNYFKALSKLVKVKKSFVVHNDECLIHVRGGDFIGTGWEKICNKSYYQKSFEFFKQIGVTKFKVITDD